MLKRSSGGAGGCAFHLQHHIHRGGMHEMQEQRTCFVAIFNGSSVSRPQLWQGPGSMPGISMVFMMYRHAMADRGLLRGLSRWRAPVELFNQNCLLWFVSMLAPALVRSHACAHVHADIPIDPCLKLLTKGV